MCEKEEYVEKINDIKQNLLSHSYTLEILQIVNFYPVLYLKWKGGDYTYIHSKKRQAYIKGSIG